MEPAAEVFLRFVRPHWKRLHLLARRYAVSGEDVRDLVQETLLRAWRSFSSTDETTYRRAWLFVIMRNVAVDWQRMARRRVNLVSSSSLELTDMAPSDPTEPFAPLPSMDEARFREFLDDHLVAALDELDPSFREVILCSVVADLSYREVAQVLDCPLGTVMSRMARARRALRERLADVARSAGWVTEGRS